MHALHDRPLPARRVRRPAPSHLVLPVARHAALLRERHASAWCRPTSPRCTRSCATARTTRWWSRPRRHPTGTATSPSASRPTTRRASSGGLGSSSRSPTHMPRTFGRNQIHVSQVVGWCRTDRPLVEVRTRRSDRPRSRRSPASSPSGSRTVRPSRPASARSRTRSCRRSRDHRDLGVHTELLSDGVVDLIEAGVVNGVRKELNRTKTVGTFALGTDRLHEFLAREHRRSSCGRCATSTIPAIIGRERDFVSINATLSVDFLGQCASETIDGQLLLVVGRTERLRSWRDVLRRRPGIRRAALDDQLGRTSRIVPRLAAGDVVTTPKNTVDKVVTEFGVAELRGRSIRERTRRPDRHRPPRPPRRAHRRGRGDALPLNDDVLRFSAIV